MIGFGWFKYARFKFLSDKKVSKVKVKVNLDPLTFALYFYANVFIKKRPANTSFLSSFSILHVFFLFTIRIDPLTLVGME